MQLKKLMIIEGLINSKSCAAKTICVCLFGGFGKIELKLETI
jgi:hypothetical protein